MKDIEQQAQAILLRARQQAEQLLAAAQVEAQDLRAQEKALGFTEGKEQGFTTGREEGLAAGITQALQEHRSSLTELITALNDASQQIEDSRQRLDEQAQVEVVKLAIAIADRVTKRRAASDPRVLTDNLIAAVKMVVHATDLRIAVHPAQRQTLIEILPKLALEWPNLQHLELMDDPQLTPGGCRIHTRGGLVDADLDEQLARIAAELVPAPAGDAQHGAGVSTVRPPR